MKYYIIGILLILAGLTYYYNKDYSLYLKSSDIMAHQKSGMYLIKTPGDTKPKVIALKGLNEMTEDELETAQRAMLSASQIQVEAKESDVGDNGEIYVTAWADGIRIN